MKRFTGAAVFLSLLLPLAIMAWFGYVGSKRNLTDLVRARRDVVVSLAALTLREKFERIKDIGVSLASRVQFRRLIEEGRWNEAREILRRVPVDFPFIDRILLTDPDGTLQADIPEAPDVKGKNFSYRDWYQGVRRTDGPYVSEPYRRMAAPQYNVIAAATPIKTDEGNFVGILVLQVKLDTLVEWMRNIEVGLSGFVYVVDGKGRLVSHPKFPPQGGIVDYSSRAEVRKVLQGAKGVGVFFDPDEGEDRLIAYSPVPDYGWGVLAAQPSREAFAFRHDALKSLLKFYGAVFLVALLLGAFIVRTLAARKKAEEEAKELNKELEAFSYSISHDLRAPLRAIDGFSLALLEDYPDRLDAVGRDYLQKLRAASQHMARLIDDMLSLSRVTRSDLDRDRVDLSALAGSVAEELKKTDPARSVEFVIEPGLTAQGDRRFLKIALDNLLGNAWKYTGKHPQARIEVRMTRRNGQPIYFVKDDGAGFDMAYVDKLFGVFQRLHKMSEFPGTGVGLATAARIIHKHGGRIWAEGEVEKGATFYFTL